MRLTHVSIEGFRGIRRMDLDFDAVTVVIGENNHGKTSVFDALGLCLGRRRAGDEGVFRRTDFYRADGRPTSIRIVLTFGLDDAETATVHEAVAPALRTDADGRARMRAEFTAAPPDRRVRPRFIDERGTPLDPQPPADVLERLQSLHPVFLLRFAHPNHQHWADDDAPADRERRGRKSLESLISRVYRDLAHVRGPLPAGEIARGLRAAQRLYSPDGADGSSDATMHRLLRELITSFGDGPGTEGVGGGHKPAGGGSQTVGLLLVLGAMLEVMEEQALPEGATPIIAIEEPEAHLHPILLASTWDVIEALRAQTVVTTNSGELLGSVPMKYLRRLVRGEGRIAVHRLHEHTLTGSDLRRVSYHVRAKRGGVLFARCWLLVEGESEFWLMSQLASVLGYDLDAEGVRPMEFAQCGVTPLVKLANDLGIRWHLLADGDESGGAYVRDAADHLDGDLFERRISRLDRRNVERYLWRHGFEDVYREAAGIPHGRDGPGRPSPPSRVIAKAVRRKSKPYLAIVVAEECAARGPQAVPRILRRVIERSVSLAREVLAGSANR